MSSQVRDWGFWNKVILTAIIFILSPITEASALHSDDFNTATTEPNPAWHFYDPYDTTSNDNDPGESKLIFDGTNAVIKVPKGLPHNLWKTTNSNKAPRLLQTAADTDFKFEVKFETAPKVKHQLQGIIVQQSNNIFLRFDVFYNISGVHLFVAYVDGTSGTVTTYKSIALSNSPSYRQVIRSGDDWTFRYSNDGSTWADAVTFTQSLAVTEVGFFAGTIGANPDFISSVDYFMDLDQPIDDSDTRIVPRSTPVSPPVIRTWYEYGQPSSGQLGISQKWINILGNVSTDINLSTLTYTINGNSESEKTLNFGSDSRRLQEEGDFTIEIDHTDLNVGFNQIEIKTKDSHDQLTKKIVTINYAPGQYWPLPYTANWGSLTNIRDIENIAHVVDGLWKLTNKGIRTVQTGYDRAIAIGDMTWESDYEVILPFTLHSGFSGIGFAVGWQGHEGVRSPKIEWPLQALAWIRGPISNPTLEILTYGGLAGWEVIETPDPQQSVSISKNVTYMLKSSSKTLGNGKSRFRVKLWPKNEVEPVAWNVNADVPTRDGSVLLVAYNTDVTFGNVIIKPLSGLSDTVSPVISNIKISAVTDSTATISWETDEPSNSVINYGLNSQYGSKEINATQTKTHSLTLTGLSSNTSYHYQVKSADSSNNTANSGDKIFTTKDSSSIGLVSDDFNGNIDSSVWTFYDPAGDSALSTTGTQATISVPAGSSHDLWKNNLLAPRIKQATNNTDFEVEVKFDSTLSAKYQGNGVTVEQDPTNLVRFDFYTDGAVTYIFSASFVDGTPKKQIQLVITKGASLYLRVTRKGDQWTTSYSTNGSNWTVADVYTHSLNVTSVAIFGGNAGSNPPEHNLLVDYFRVNNISSN